MTFYGLLFLNAKYSLSSRVLSLFLEEFFFTGLKWATTRTKSFNCKKLYLYSVINIWKYQTNI